MKAAQTWSLVLAGGEGSRLRTLTTNLAAPPSPSSSAHSMANARCWRTQSSARRRSPPQGIRASSWLRSIGSGGAAPLARLPKANVIVQPFNRGTAIGILYPLLHILARDPHARLVILPSDHYVRQEKLLQRSARSAIELLVHDTDAPILLGLEPEEPDPELGYIIPGERSIDGGRSIQRFIEKPPAHLAREIIRQGGLWNTFIIVQQVRAC